MAPSTTVEGPLPRLDFAVRIPQEAADGNMPPSPLPHPPFDLEVMCCAPSTNIFCSPVGPVPTNPSATNGTDNHSLLAHPIAGIGASSVAQPGRGSGMLCEACLLATG
eukprot:922246-Amphidinium_carterae.1